MNFYNFSDVVKSFAVDWDAEKNFVDVIRRKNLKSREILLRFGDVVVKDLISGQYCNETRILHRPVKVHQWSMCLEAVQ
jgi:hypothetical protein